MFCAGSDVHVKGQDLQLLRLLPAHQQDRCGPEKKSVLSNNDNVDNLHHYLTAGNIEPKHANTEPHCVCIYLCAL